MSTLLSAPPSFAEQRRELRLQIAEKRIKWNHTIEVESAIKHTQVDADAAVAQHAAACEPLQTELRDIERRQISDMADKLPRSEATEARRVELLAGIEAENEKLAGTVRKLQEKAVRLQAELNGLLGSIGTTPEVLESKLAELGSDDELADLHYSQQSVLWIQLRAEKAREALKNAAAMLDSERHGGDPQHIYSRRKAKWERELQRISVDMGKAQQEATTLRQRLIEQ